MLFISLILCRLFSVSFSKVYVGQCTTSSDLGNTWESKCISHNCVSFKPKAKFYYITEPAYYTRIIDN